MVVDGGWFGMWFGTDSRPDMLPLLATWENFDELIVLSAFCIEYGCKMEKVGYDNLL